MEPAPAKGSLRVVVVHGGAGFHPRPRSSENVTKRALRFACAQALSTAESSGFGTALQGAVEAITVLEDEGSLNAGYGSNLTMNGGVECDASIMDGRSSDFGAIGATSSLKNPIQVALSVLQYSRTPDPLGRIPPLLLVSSGAEDFARTRGMVCPPEDMVSPRALSEWKKWKDALANAQQASPAGTTAETSAPLARRPPQVDGLHDRQDTVGAIVLDAEGNLAAGVSSGGLLLKLPGRVGEAAVHGAGCWATYNTACSVSGAGEYITRMSLARAICETVEAAGDGEDTHDILQRILGQQFHKLCLERGETSPQAGVILLVKEYDDGGEPRPRLWCAFTTESMAIGYASSSSKPTVRPHLDPCQKQGLAGSSDRCGH
ncbi:N-terminal nucleophile aminohydrolase [Lenzites betulinus]|nr:N-terminal nucleophile aminohydrolase [Lenzites betulinus]